MMNSYDEVSNALLEIDWLQADIKDIQEELHEATTKLTDEIERLQSVCKHPFVLVRVGHMQGLMGIGMLESEYNICILCGKEDKYFDAHFEYQEGRQEPRPMLESAWWCQLFHENGERNLKLDDYRALVRDPELAIKSWDMYLRLSENENFNREDEAIPFVKFCHEQAQRYVDAHSGEVSAEQS